MLRMVLEDPLYIGHVILRMRSELWCQTNCNTLRTGKFTNTDVVDKTLICNGIDQVYENIFTY